MLNSLVVLNFSIFTPSNPDPGGAWSFVCLSWLGIIWKEERKGTGQDWTMDQN